MSVFVEVYQWEPGLDANGQARPTMAAGIRLLDRLSAAGREGSTVASSLADTLLELWGGPEAKQLRPDPTTTVPEPGSLAKKSAAKDGKR